MPRRDGAECCRCLFFQPVDHMRYGECRCSAPQAVSAYDNRDAKWPYVYPGDWCGDWEWSGAEAEEIERVAKERGWNEDAEETTE